MPAFRRPLTAAGVPSGGTEFTKLAVLGNGPETDVDLGRPELSGVGGDHEVAGKGEAEAAGQAVAPHPGDGRLAQRPQLAEHARHPAPRLVRARGADVGPDPAEIGAGAEGP